VSVTQTVFLLRAKLPSHNEWQDALAQYGFSLVLHPDFDPARDNGVTVDYPTLGVHSAALPLMSKAEVVSTLTADLATVNHISIYTTTYGDNGAHLVHRNGTGHDGLLVTQPLATPPHLRMLSFSDQSC
jgi:hypothetical protein